MYAPTREKGGFTQRIKSTELLGEGMVVWKVKLGEMKMSPEKDLLTLNVEEHGLDLGAHRKLSKGISRANKVRSPCVRWVGR